MYIDIHTERFNIIVIIAVNLPEPRRAVKKRSSSFKAVMSSITLPRRTNKILKFVPVYSDGKVQLKEELPFICDAPKAQP